MDDSEKRQYPRSKAGFKIKYRISEHLPVHTVDAFDVSATGLSFISPEIVAEGQHMEFNLNIEEMNKTIPAKGTVVRNYMEDGKSICSVKITAMDYDDFISMLDYSLAFMED